MFHIAQTTVWPKQRTIEGQEDSHHNARHFSSHGRAASASPARMHRMAAAKAIVCSRRRAKSVRMTRFRLVDHCECSRLRLSACASTRVSQIRLSSHLNPVLTILQGAWKDRRQHDSKIQIPSHHCNQFVKSFAHAAQLPPHQNQSLSR